MVSAHDVAAYILAHGAGVTAMKLQKLLYYAQAWSLAWDEVPLYPEDIRAWAMGPVVHEVWTEHRGARVVTSHARGDASKLSTTQRATVDAVLEFYGPFDGDALSDLSHRERPWRDAYAAAPHARPSPIITHDALRAAYDASVAPARAFSAAYARGVQLLMSIDADAVEELEQSDAVEVDLRAEIAWLEGSGPDPWRA